MFWFPSLVCACASVLFLLSLVIIFRRCVLSSVLCVKRKTTNNTIRVLPSIFVYRFSSLLLLLLSYSLSLLETPDKRSLWLVCFFIFSLSLSLFARVLLLSDDVLCLSICVCGMLSSRETENLFFPDRMQNKKRRNGHLLDHTHIYIDPYT